MSDWKEVLLGDIAHIQTGPFGSQLHASDYVLDGLPCVMPKNIGSRLNIETEGIARVGSNDIQRLKKHKLKTGDIVYSRRGDVEKCAYIKSSEEGWLCGTGCLLVRSNEEYINSRFLSYLLSTSECKGWLVSQAVGTTMPNLNTGILQNLPICLPSKDQQQLIAEVLSSLDDKIDLLHRNNKTLEQLAETLFRQWFIDEAEIQSENKLPLGNYFETVSKTHKFNNESVIFLNTSDVYKGEVLVNEYSDIKTLPGQAKKSIQKGDILFSEIRPANGRWAYINFAADDYVVSTKLMVLRAKSNIDTAFLYFYLTNTRTLDYLQTLAESRSGTFPQITFDQLNDLKINIPSQKILNGTVSWCKAALDKICQNQKQVRLLESVRNELLPKLMGGTVKIIN